ncbi:MAG: hypothetical protein JRF60_14025 [Deltaproteobacteria bacterium]|nr:hypothetical protein [Deltaproteobacteria bacterium]
METDKKYNHANAADAERWLIQMRLIIFILITGFGFFNCPVVIHANDISSSDTVFVFKLDGTVHCENSKGITLDSMEQKLTSAGIKVFSRRKGYDGREGIALCGAPTGQVNIYEIASSDLSIALKLGFKPIPENWNRAGQ